MVRPAKGAAPEEDKMPAEELQHMVTCMGSTKLRGE